MKTENQMKALDLAKKVFEHFTRDALSLAREIIAIEDEVKQSGESTIDFPTSDISPSDLGITQELLENGKPLDRERTISSEVDKIYPSKIKYRL